MSGFLRRENSVSGDIKLHIQPHDKALENVAKFMEKGKAKVRERIAKKHELDNVEEHKEEGDDARSRTNSEVHSDAHLAHA